MMPSFQQPMIALNKLGSWERQTAELSSLVYESERVVGLRLDGELMMLTERQRRVRKEGRCVGGSTLKRSSEAPGI